MVRYLRLSALILTWLVLTGLTWTKHWTLELYTGESVTVGWDIVSNADSYKWELVSHERGNAVFAQGSTTATTASIVIPKTGHWIVRVKAVNANGESAWAESTGPEARAEGQTQPWWIFAWLAPATGPEIE